MASFLFSRRPFVLAPALRWGTKTRDLLAGMPLVLLYGFNATAKVHALNEAVTTFDPANFDSRKFLTFLSDISILSVALLFVICVLMRPPAVARAQGIMPRIAAIAGTYLAVGLVLLSNPTATSLTTICISLLLVLFGMSFAAWSVFYLGRSVSLMAEARRLVTGGPYRFVRHPLYLGEQIAIAGVMLRYLSPVAIFVFMVQIAFQLYRMSCEEKVLTATFPEYADYARHTWRVLPGLY
jgi:protein-S-isoprenylcysteine O-methyltransferase Ste14